MGVTSGSALEHFFVYENTALQTLNAPADVNITTMTGTFQLRSNPALAIFTGLSGLVHIDGSFEFDNTQVAAMPSFPLLDYIGGNLQIQDNPYPTSLAMPNLATGMFVGYSIFLNNNSAITEYNLMGVTSGSDLEHFFVYENTALQTLNAPADANIYTMTGSFQLRSNPALAIFTGLSGLVHVVGSFQFDNTQIASLANLNSLATVGGSVTVQSNPNLSTCSLEPICYRVAVNNQAVLPFQIYGNAAGCLPPNITGCGALGPLRFFSKDGDAYGNSLIYHYGGAPYPTTYTYGNPPVTVPTTPASKWKVNPNDCDDNNAAVKPPNLIPNESISGANLGIDNDCDGLIDEDIRVTKTITNAVGCTATGKIVLTVSGGVKFNGNVVEGDVLGHSTTPHYHYEWSNGVTGKDNLNLLPGLYTVTITDNNGRLQVPPNTTSFLTKIIEYEVGYSGPTGLTLNNSVLVHPCPGLASGSIDISPVSSSGNTSFTYNWSPGGETTEDISNKLAGTYKVTVTDGVCQAKKTFKLIAPSVMQITLAAKNPLCPTTATGEIKATVSGGSGDKTYLWSPGGETTQEITGLLANYSGTVTASDSKGCMVSMPTPALSDPTPVVLSHTTSPLPPPSTKFKVVLSASGGTHYANGLTHRYCRVNAAGNCNFSQAFTYSNLLFESTHYFKARDKNDCQTDEYLVMPPLKPSSDRTTTAFHFDSKMKLHQNRPNPFSDETTLGFYLPSEMRATVSVFDATGALLFQKSEIFPAGENSVLLDASDLGASRVLICRLETASGVAVRQMLRMEK